MDALASSELVRHYTAGHKVDLTHPLVEGMPVWPGHPRFCHDLLESYDKGDASLFHGLSLGEHTGTHIDAPLHFIPEPQGWSVDKAPIEDFIGQMVVQDHSNLEGGSGVSAAMINAWEEQHQVIQSGDSVFFYFGWDQYWYSDPGRFFESWPGVDESGARYLVNKGVRLVGSDCLSIDPSTSKMFEAHRALLGAGVMIGENFNNLAQVGPVATLAGFPLPIVGGSGSPLRAIAVIDPPK